MAQAVTKEIARNIFYGGTVFFLLLFLALTFDTTLALPARDQRAQLDPNTDLGQQIALGKSLWERYDCIGCHTLLGEGAYFAPELGDVYQRYNESKDGIKEFIKSRPVNGIPGRRSMPQFHFTEKQLDAIAEFLKYCSEIDTNNWPPNKQG
jgi:nitric oxide reductase subunit C